MSGFEIFVTTPWCLFSMLIAIVVLGWLFIIKLFPLNAITWQKIDLICMLVTSVGIIGILSDNRLFLYERELNKLEPQMGQFEWRFEWELSPHEYERYFNPGLYSFDEIELIERDFSKMSLCVKQFRDTILKFVDKRIYIDTTVFECPIFSMPGSTEEFRRKIESIKPIIIDYNQFVDKYNHYKEGKEKKWFEILYDILSPLFVTIGLAFQIIKWLWENRKDITNTRC